MESRGAGSEPHLTPSTSSGSLSSLFFTLPRGGVSVTSFPLSSTNTQQQKHNQQKSYQHQHVSLGPVGPPSGSSTPGPATALRRLLLARVDVHGNRTNSWKERESEAEQEVVGTEPPWAIGIGERDPSGTASPPRERECGSIGESRERRRTPRVLERERERERVMRHVKSMTDLSGRFLMARTKEMWRMRGRGERLSPPPVGELPEAERVAGKESGRYSETSLPVDRRERDADAWMWERDLTLAMSLDRERERERERGRERERELQRNVSLAQVRALSLEISRINRKIRSLQEDSWQWSLRYSRRMAIASNLVLGVWVFGSVLKRSLRQRERFFSLSRSLSSLSRSLIGFRGRATAGERESDLLMSGGVPGMGVADQRERKMMSAFVSFLSTLLLPSYELSGASLEKEKERVFWAQRRETKKGRSLYRFLIPVLARAFTSSLSFFFAAFALTSQNSTTRNAGFAVSSLSSIYLALSGWKKREDREGPPSYAYLSYFNMFFNVVYIIARYYFLHGILAYTGIRFL